MADRAGNMERQLHGACGSRCPDNGRGCRIVGLGAAQL